LKSVQQNKLGANLRWFTLARSCITKTTNSNVYSNTLHLV